MRNILSILLVVTVLQGELLKGFYAIQYQVQKEYYALELCEFKEVEGNACQGNCHLSKQLQRVEKSEDVPGEIPLVVFLGQEITLAIEFSEVDFKVANRIRKGIPCSKIFYKRLYAKEIDHPPKCEV